MFSFRRGRVFEVATGDLAGMGIVVISYTIKEISDDVGYLKVIHIYQNHKVKIRIKLSKISGRTSG